MRAAHPPSGRRSTLALVLALLVYAGLVALFWSGRYGGQWMDGDAARLSLSADGILQEGRLVTQRYAYASGFGFQVVLALASAVGGVTIQAIQLASVVWLVALALVAFVSYRELTGNRGTAILAAMLLLLQPDFLFYVLRASHEKLTWTLALLLLYLLARGYRVSRDVRRFAAHVLLFYLAFWAMVGTNTFFASSFLAAIVFSLLGSRVLRWLSRRGARGPGAGDLLAPRLLWVSAAGMVLVFAFITYLYRPAASYYNQLPSVVDRVGALFLGAQPDTRSLGYVQTAWRHPLAYLALTSAQWLIVLGSLAGWVTDASRLGQARPGQRLLWLMYGGFGAALAAGTVLDLAGFLSANLQVRLFTAFALVSSPMAATFLARAARGLRRRVRRVGAALAVAGIGLAVAASLLKATNDPSVGNQWLFYAPGELEGLRWVDQHAQNRPVWVDIFSHQFDVFSFWQGYAWRPTNAYTAGRANEGTPDILYSRLTQLQANRSELTLPPTTGHDRVYDNGGVQFFRRRPQTPYQR